MLGVDSSPASEAPSHLIPNEADVLGDDGEQIGGVLFFERDGYLSELEVYSTSGEPISELPSLAALRFPQAPIAPQRSP